MYDIGQATTFDGLPADISSNAPEGILWLKSFWTSLDSLDTSASPPLTAVVSPVCQFRVNGSEPRDLNHIQESFSQRSQFLSEFGHTKYPVKVIDVDLGNGKRLLSVQSTSVSVIKADPDQTELRVAESTVIELETYEGKLLATNVVSYLDPMPVLAKMQEVTTIPQP
ncbi:uncharacterized protein PV09_07722 [Verruconis gallopava]|uniref:Uncharacterized protein n=1 Tax=Verruconis gallopava TaxID=253628 RepID=A0A0D2A1V5_9PEZI|nr:uncharacterized protein PV09_07722 [Verruconis gallopava]KIW00738.1 hypothetical protein PV09_07722 [Verruconis gallopava]